MKTEPSRSLRSGFTTRCEPTNCNPQTMKQASLNIWAGWATHTREDNITYNTQNQNAVLVPVSYQLLRNDCSNSQQKVSLNVFAWGGGGGG